MILALMMVTFLLSNQLSVIAAENEDIMLCSASLTGCSLGVVIKSNGMGVDYSTGFTTTASEIGCKDIILQEKHWYGWKDISLGTASATNKSSYSGSMTYTGATTGTTYRAKCTHYAAYNGVTYTFSSETGELVYN